MKRRIREKTLFLHFCTHLWCVLHFCLHRPHAAVLGADRCTGCTPGHPPVTHTHTLFYFLQTQQSEIINRYSTRVRENKYKQHYIYRNRSSAYTLPSDACSCESEKAERAGKKPKNIRSRAKNKGSETSARLETRHETGSDSRQGEYKLRSLAYLVQRPEAPA